MKKRKNNEKKETSTIQVEFKNIKSIFRQR